MYAWWTVRKRRADVGGESKGGRKGVISSRQQSERGAGKGSKGGGQKGGEGFSVNNPLRVKSKLKVRGGL
jgi:hypothetical protein